MAEIALEIVSYPTEMPDPETAAHFLAPAVPAGVLLGPTVPAVLPAWDLGAAGSAEEEEGGVS